MMTGKLKTLLKAGLLTGLMSLCSVSEAGWPRFDEFKAVSMEGGRVIDYSDPRHITTSEGQSYALFFALVAGDRQTFDDIWQWTKSHLMAESPLPAWLYGKLPLSEDPQRPSDATGVLDDNNATDSDLWIAYSLLEAARIFKEPAYREEALKLMEALKGCTRKVPHLGLILLPGLQGFEDENAYLFNPSYCPYFLLSRLALEDPFYKELNEGCLRALLRTSVHGVAPDWARLDRRGNYLPSAEERGSYNAVRVYLFAGMLAPDTPVYARLKEHFAPVINAYLTQKSFMEPIAVQELTVLHDGPLYLGLSMLPWLPASKVSSLLRHHLNQRGMLKDGYYGNVLTLFALGFDSGRFHFLKDGTLCVTEPFSYETYGEE